MRSLYTGQLLLAAELLQQLRKHLLQQHLQIMQQPVIALLQLRQQ